MIKASVNLNIQNNWLVFAGRGHQPNCDFPVGNLIGEELTPCSDDWLEVKTVTGKIYKIKHDNYYECN